jgi:hypothetical protein
MEICLNFYVTLPSCPIKFVQAWIQSNQILYAQIGVNLKRESSESHLFNYFTSLRLGFSAPEV